MSNWHDVGDYLIEHVTEDDEGGYSCLASSAAGLIQSSVANLIANGKMEFNLRRIQLLHAFTKQEGSV